MSNTTTHPGDRTLTFRYGGSDVTIEYTITLIRCYGDPTDAKLRTADRALRDRVLAALASDGTAREDAP